MAGKNSATGRLGVVKWNDGSQPLHWSVNLPLVLDREKNYYEQRTAVGQPEIDNAVRTWFKVYHSLVWLNAAINQNCYAVNSPFTGTVPCDCPGNPFTEGELYCLEESRLVPAFSAIESGCMDGDMDCHEVGYNAYVNIEVGDNEVGNETRTGWIFEDVRIIFNDKNSELTLKTLGEEFAERIYQEVGNRTQLQRFLNKFKQLSPDFDAANCIDSCLRSRSEMGFGQDAKENIYVDEALKLIKDLWVEQQLETHLTEMKKWVSDSNESPGSQEWLESQLALASIVDKIGPLFNSDKLEAKKNVSRWTAILEINTTTFTCIYNRLGLESDDTLLGFEVAQGLEAAIKNLAISTSTRRIWNDLLYATYGAVAWQIFHQASLAAEHVRQTLKEVGLHE